MFNIYNSDNNYLSNFYSPEFYIDSFHNSQKLITDKVILDKTLNKAVNTYIDAQTAFAKVLVSNTMDMAKFVTETTTDKLFQKQSKKASSAA
jgi:hypothetical protein